MEISFVIKNHNNDKEVLAILGDIGVSIVHTALNIHAIQTENIRFI